MRRFLTYSLLFLLLPATLWGQSLRKAVPEYDFARFEKNRIGFQGDSSAFERLFKKMDSVLFLGKGNLRIMHFGGSHVQAGTLTRQLRNDLLSLRTALDGQGTGFPVLRRPHEQSKQFHDKLRRVLEGDEECPAGAGS